jgi:hypothetical protein
MHRLAVVIKDAQRQRQAAIGRQAGRRRIQRVQGDDFERPGIGTRLLAGVENEGVLVDRQRGIASPHVVELHFTHVGEAGNAESKRRQLALRNRLADGESR